MGQSMAGHLLHAGAHLTVYSRTESKARPLLDRGASWARVHARSPKPPTSCSRWSASPTTSARCTSATTASWRAARVRPVLVDMTTSEPSLAVEIAQSGVRARRVRALDAPVSGGDVGAQERELSIMVGGDAERRSTRSRPLLRADGQDDRARRAVRRRASTPRCVNQILIAGDDHRRLRERCSMAPRQAWTSNACCQSVRGGAAGCWSLDNLGAAHHRRQFRAGLLRRALHQGHGHRARRGARMQLALPGLALVRQLYIAATAQGHGRAGTQALYLALRQLSEIGGVRSLNPRISHGVTP